MGIVRPLARPMARSMARTLTQGEGVGAIRPLYNRGLWDDEGKWDDRTPSSLGLYVDDLWDDRGFWDDTMEVAPADAPATILSLWTGAPSTGGVTITAKLDREADEVRIVASVNEDLSSPAISDPVETDGTYKLARISIGGLTADTAYWYGLQVDGNLVANMKGRFKTFPVSHGNFSCGFASCAATGTTAPVFTRMNERRLLFFQNMGDLHYGKPASNDEALFQANFDAVFANSVQGSAYRETPLLYMWDDHDYGVNDGDKDSFSRAAAVAAYRRRVPSPPLANEDADGPVYYTYKVGRCRVIVTDLRSAKDPKGATADSERSAMGATQKTWFKGLLTAAVAADEYVWWVSTFPWDAAPANNTDAWRGYSAERIEIADHIKASGLQGRMFMTVGDAHMLAIDAANGDYATGGGALFPIFHAAPMAAPVSHKFGGPYSVIGPLPESNEGNAYQYGTMDVVDDLGDTVSITWKGWSTDRTSGVETQIAEYSFEIDMAA